MALAGVDDGHLAAGEAEAALGELRRLAESTGAVVLGETLVRLRRIDPATYFSSGKVEELRALLETLGADGLVVDTELSPTHQRNLEEALGVRVIDRTLVILDIFARRARSQAGKLQVETAQLRYRLPRLKGQGTSLSRLGGGIGTRGPGESKLEADRRRVGERLAALEKQLRQLEATRQTQRRERERHAIPNIALVGYTNAGKSTLINALAEAGVFAADQLFATLDPTTRMIRLPGGMRATLTDTVGFIHRLPTSLIAAFHATLEEIARASLLIEVVDAASPQLSRELRATEAILGELGALQIPRIIAWNKADRLASGALPRLEGEAAAREGVLISARHGDGLANLLALAERTLTGEMVSVTLEIPLGRGDLMSRLREMCEVRSILWRPDAAEVECRVPRAGWERFERLALAQEGVRAQDAPADR